MPHGSVASSLGRHLSSAKRQNGLLESLSFHSRRDAWVGTRDNGVAAGNGLWQDTDMNREQVIATLREHEPELRAAGVTRLALHRSYVRRSEIGGVSDVDVIADFDRARQLSLFGRVHLENRLTDILGVKADLADRAMLLPEVLENAERESVLVF